MTPILLGLTTVMAMLYLYHAHKNKVLKTDALVPRGQWSSHRLTFLNFGLVFALGFVTMAFEYESTKPNYNRDIVMEINDVVDTEVIRTSYPEPDEIPPPPPVDKVKPKFNPLAEIDLVDDTKELPDLDLLEDIPMPLSDNEKVVIAPPPPPKPPAPPKEVDHGMLDIVPFAEVMPMFPGCENSGLSNAEQQQCATKQMLEYIYANLRYPQIARDINIQGTAVVSFVVERDGSITNAKVVREPGASLGEEALKVVNSFPKWIPGKQRGRPVRVQFNLPVKFRLE